MFVRGGNLSLFNAIRPIVTLKTLAALKGEGKRFTCITAYDSTFAEIASGVGIEVLLLGDSLGMIIQGHESTLKKRCA